MFSKKLSALLIVEYQQRCALCTPKGYGPLGNRILLCPRHRFSYTTQWRGRSTGLLVGN